MSVEHIDAMTGEILPSLAECEETIARGVRGYVEAGEALRIIRDARLYRETHGTFEDYCRERWGWSDPRHAYRMIESAGVCDQLVALGSPTPANEAQARELVGLPAETAAEIMRTAAETGQTVTARIIRETRVQITQPKETPKEAPMTAASRLAIPQPPKYGGNRPKHNQVIGNVIVSAQGLCIVADEIQALDGSINNEEAASYASDLSRIIRSLKRIQQLLTKEV